MALMTTPPKAVLILANCGATSLKDRRPHSSRPFHEQPFDSLLSSSSTSSSSPTSSPSSLSLSLTLGLSMNMHPTQCWSSSSLSSHGRPLGLDSPDAYVGIVFHEVRISAIIVIIPDLGLSSLKDQEPRLSHNYEKGGCFFLQQSSNQDCNPNYWSAENKH